MSIRDIWREGLEGTPEGNRRRVLVPEIAASFETLFSSTLWERMAQEYVSESKECRHRHLFVDFVNIHNWFYEADLSVEDAVGQAMMCGGDSEAEAEATTTRLQRERLRLVPTE